MKAEAVAAIWMFQGRDRRSRAIVKKGGNIQLQPTSSSPHDGVVKLKQAPVSFSQQQLWFLDQLVPGLVAYNVARAMRLRGILSTEALTTSLNEVVRRHEALRTSFSVVNGTPVQVIVSDLQVEVPVLNLEDVEARETETEVKRLVIEEARHPFDLSRCPLLRARLLRLKDDEHVLLLTMHHIISDGWSIGVLMGELSTLYEAHMRGMEAKLPDLRIQYADFAKWQREWLCGKALEKQLEYWRHELSGELSPLELPTDRPRPRMQTFNGELYRFALQKKLVKGLKYLARSQRVTPFMCMMAAFQVFLHRYCGQDDIIVGTPIANRTHEKTEQLIGFFANMLLFRGRLSGDLSFREYLGQIRKAALHAYVHKDLPFEKLVEVLQPTRDLSRNPLFQVVLAFQNMPARELRLLGLEVEPLEVRTGTSKFDLTLYLTEVGEELAGSLEYNTDLFEEATAARLAEHFHTLLESIVANPDAQMSDLVLLTQIQRHQMLVEWNATQVAYPSDACLHELFETQVARTPNAPVVVYEGKQLTYQELNQRANQLAHRLQRLGVGPEVLIAICMERSLELVVGILGVLKAGGAYMPLDPTYPKERLAYMLADAQPTALLTQARLVGRLPEYHGHVVCLDTDWEMLISEPEEDPQSGVRSDNSVYVIYTSGSTGLPKGVITPHRAIVNHGHAVARHYGLQANDRILQFASLSFDVVAEELFPTWLSGACVVLRSSQLPPAPIDFLAWADRNALTILNLPTAYWHEWMDQLACTTMPCPRTLRLVIVGGEQVLPERFAIWRERVGDHVRWINAYGPTEATITATIYEPTSSQKDREAWSVPIGHPIDNVQAYVLDAHLQPVPVGVPGEIYIGGDGVTRGYLHYPELTAKHFIPHPFSPVPGARLYRTGDRARYLPTGDLEYLGRSDYQAKIRGFRIEPGEIEAVLGQHPAVRESVVMAHEGTPGVKRLVAYVVPHQKQAPTGSELRNYLKERLPEYMIPAAFILLGAWPLMPNGKVDRHALPPPDQASQDPQGLHIEPRNSTEKILADIWTQVLGCTQVSIHDNFFELGGHSLLAIQVISRVLQTFRVELPLQSFFEAPTIAGLAVVVARNLAEQIDSEVLTHMLAELEQLSEDEVQILIIGNEQADKKMNSYG